MSPDVSEERMQVLKMVAEGKVSAEEGAKLLAAVEEIVAAGRPAPQPAKWFRVRVFNERSGKSVVNVNLPVSLLDVAMGIGMRFIPKEDARFKDIDLQAIMAAIKEGAMGKIVDVTDEEEGMHVEVFVE